MLRQVPSHYTDEQPRRFPRIALLSDKPDDPMRPRPGDDDEHVAARAWLPLAELQPPGGTSPRWAGHRDADSDRYAAARATGVTDATLVAVMWRRTSWRSFVGHDATEGRPLAVGSLTSHGEWRSRTPQPPGCRSRGGQLRRTVPSRE